MNLEIIKQMASAELKELMLETTDPSIYIPKGLSHDGAREVLQATVTEIANRNNKLVVPITLDRNSLLVKTGLVTMPEPVVYKGHAKPRRFSHRYFICVDGADHEVRRKLFHNEMEKLIGTMEWKRRRYDKHGYHPIVNHTNKQPNLKTKDGQFVWTYKGHKIEAKCIATLLKGE